MRNDYYPTRTVEALMETDLVTSTTRLALQNRLDRKHITEPKFFDAEIFVTLHAVCDRLIPQPEINRRVDIAGCLDGILAEGKGNGWRYDAMPPDGEAFTIGLHGINKTSLSTYDRSFHSLSTKEQDEVLALIQTGEAAGLTWQVLPGELFFEELLAAIVELYYSHPYAKEDIGEVAMADAKGWLKIGLNELEAQEPKPLNEEFYVAL